MEQGLYEQLLTKLISKKIQELNQTEFYIDKTKIDKNEAALVLSRHLSSTIKSALEQVKGDDKIEKQIKITNQIIYLLSEEVENGIFSDDLVETNAELLTAIYKRTNQDFTDFSKYIKEITPYTRLSQSELFTGNNAGVSIDSEIKKEILSSNSISFLVSFIKWSGIRIFEKELREFTNKGGKLRIITTTYTGATDSKAIEFLAGLKNTEIKISYNKANERLHAKAYLFYRNTGFHTGYIGSSNLSRSALTNGLEWNVKVTSLEVTQLISKFQKTFDTYWEDPEFESYNKALHSDKLKASLREEYKTFSSDGFSSYFDINPYPFQKTILEKLQIERSVHKHSKNLVVAATGTGKTMISAFDYQAFQSDNPNARILFVAHKVEILKQSIATFRAVLKNNNFGELWVANYKPDNYKQLFASVQTLLNNIDNLNVDSSYYDFIIIDEVHHISASSYRPILEKFTPKILLGLTATPERHDGGDILEDFDNRIAAEIRLPEALNRKLLTPFQYFGISDNIDLSKANWINGHYDSKELTSLFVNSKTRIRDIVDNFEKYVTDKEEVRALGFCITQEHAKHMSDSFNSIGLKSDYLTSQNGNRRDELRGKFKSKEINYLFVVDIFNEGVDIPEIDTVLFLRPTESLTIFLQQLGRGLRLCDKKDVLTVLDFVSNSRPEYDFENKFRAIIGKTNNPIKKEVEDDFPHLPLGCSIVLEKKAKEHILFNIEAATRYNKKDIINKIRIFRHNTELSLTLKNFTSFYNIPLQYIYKSSTWSELKYIAKVENNYSTTNEKQMLSAIKNKWLSTESLSYFSFILNLAKNKFNIELEKLSDEEQNMSLMLYYDFWQENALHHNLENAIKQIGKNEFFIKEIIELMETLIDRISFSESSISLPYKQPLKLHSRYTRDQILAAFGKSTYQKKSSSREGVAENKELNTEILFINLIKSEKDFSPTTLYNDYAISEKIFHWQSQNSAIPERGKGLSYINHNENNKIILLFVREQNEDEHGNTMGYVFLGEAKLKEYEGRKPMNIIWELAEPLPHYLWKASAKMSIG